MSIFRGPPKEVKKPSGQGGFDPFGCSADGSKFDPFWLDFGGTRAAWRRENYFVALEQKYAILADPQLTLLKVATRMEKAE